MKKNRILTMTLVFVFIFNISVFGASTDLPTEKNLLNSIELKPYEFILNTEYSYDEQMDQYLYESYYYSKYGISFTLEDAHNLIKSKISELTNDSMDTYTKVLTIFDWLVYNVEYGFGGYGNHLSVHSIFENKIGTCVDFSYVFSAMCRYIGINTKLVHGITYTTTGVGSGHTWVEVTINGEDYIFDPQVQNYIYVHNGYNYYTRFCKTFESLSQYYTRHSVEEYKINENVTNNNSENNYSFENKFIDVGVTDTYYESIKYVYENDIFKGTSDNTFEPNTPMNRAMFVTVLGRLANIDIEKYKSNANQFTDVKENEWYTPYVNWATEIGLIYGYGNGLFGTTDNIIHEHVNLIIGRFMDYLNVSNYDIAKDKFESNSYAKRWEVATVLYELREYMK